MSLKYMLLGTLMEKPCHGYDLKSNVFGKVFKDFGINDGQLYPMLKKLENEELVVKAVQHRDGSPSRHIYSISEAGRAEFLRWLESSAEEESSFRYDFFRKDAFFNRFHYIKHLSKEAAIAKTRHEMAVVEKTIEDLTQARESMINKGLEQVKISIVEYGIKVQEVRKEWLNDCINRFEEFHS